MNTTAPEPTSPTWVPRFVLLAAIWGVSFLLIRLGVEAFHPTQVTLGRVAFGAAVLLAVVAVRRERLPRSLKVWGHLFVAASITASVPFTLFGYAERHIPSALAGICNATTPLFTVLVALAVLPDERPTRTRLAGLVTGFAGVAVVLGVWQGFAGGVPTLMALTAAALYAAGWAYVRRFLTGTGYSLAALACGQLLMATLQLALVTPLLGGVPSAFPLRSTLAVAALGVFGTGIAYLLHHSLVRDAGATVASTVTYLIPLVSLAVGVTLLDERLHWYQVLGAGIVLLGGWLSQRTVATKAPAAPAVEDVVRESVVPAR
ncbi:transporter [Virgisporangium aliadipatigenens]|uniref:Transporter n=1 Tax=Virgisporangium aliadipatigenens TaxID=741659 RepID=A0A8J3YRG0_9ACTN|nr:DMT family transporter [Virgisporangium aliadipatigenens]GIJ48545.1 transporter [Virgisporangium aliadipatigenens]